MRLVKVQVIRLYEISPMVRMLFSSITGCNIKYNSSHKHNGSDDVLEGYVDAHKVHAVRQ